MKSALLFFWCLLVCACVALPPRSDAQEVRLTINVAQMSVSATNKVAVREQVPVRLVNIGNSSGPDLTLRYYDRTGGVLAISAAFTNVPGTNQAVGTLNLNTVQLVALFSNLQPSSPYSGRLGLWDQAQSRLLVNQEGFLVWNNPWAPNQDSVNPLTNNYYLTQSTVFTGAVNGVWNNLQFGSEASNLIVSIVGSLGNTYSNTATSAYRGDWGAAASNLLNTVRSNGMVAVTLTEATSNHAFVTLSATGALLTVLVNTNYATSDGITNFVARTGDTMSGALKINNSLTVSNALFSVYRNSGQSLYSDLPASNQLSLNALPQLGVGMSFKHHGNSSPTRGIFYVNDSSGLLGSIIVPGTNFPQITFQNTHLGGIASLVSTGQITGFHVGDGSGLSNLIPSIAINEVSSPSNFIASATNSGGIMWIQACVTNGLSQIVSYSVSSASNFIASATNNGSIFYVKYCVTNGGTGTGGSATNATLLNGIVGAGTLAVTGRLSLATIGSTLLVSNTVPDDVATNSPQNRKDGGSFPIYAKGNVYEDGGHSALNNMSSRIDFISTNETFAVVDIKADWGTNTIGAGARTGLELWNVGLSHTGSLGVTAGPVLSWGPHPSTSANHWVQMYPSGRGTNDNAADFGLWLTKPGGAAALQMVQQWRHEGGVIFSNTVTAAGFIGNGASLTNLPVYAGTNVTVQQTATGVVVSASAGGGSGTFTNFTWGTNVTTTGANVQAGSNLTFRSAGGTNYVDALGSTGAISSVVGGWLLRGLDWQAVTGSVNVGYGRVLAPSQLTPSSFSATSDEVYPLYGWTEQTLTQTSIVFGTFSSGVTGIVPWAVESTQPSGTHIFTVKDGSSAVTITQVLSGTSRVVTNLNLGSATGLTWSIESRVATTNSANLLTVGFDMSGAYVPFTGAGIAGAGSGGAGSQTPWTNNVSAAGFSLTDVSEIVMTNTMRVRFGADTNSWIGALVSGGAVTQLQFRVGGQVLVWP